MSAPLAEQVRPKDLASFVGQDKVVGQNSILRSLLKEGEVTSMILWGPPGCGKVRINLLEFALLLLHFFFYKICIV
jgi:putative ATPase